MSVQVERSVEYLKQRKNDIFLSVFGKDVVMNEEALFAPFHTGQFLILDEKVKLIGEGKCCNERWFPLYCKMVKILEYERLVAMIYEEEVVEEIEEEEIGVDDLVVVEEKEEGLKGGVKDPFRTGSHGKKERRINALCHFPTRTRSTKLYKPNQNGATFIKCDLIKEYSHEGYIDIARYSGYRCKRFFLYLNINGRTLPGDFRVVVFPVVAGAYDRVPPDDDYSKIEDLMNRPCSRLFDFSTITKKGLKEHIVVDYAPDSSFSGAIIGEFEPKYSFFWVICFFTNKIDHSPVSINYSTVSEVELKFHDYYGETPEDRAVRVTCRRPFREMVEMLTKRVDINYFPTIKFLGKDSIDLFTVKWLTVDGDYVSEMMHPFVDSCKYKCTCSMVIKFVDSRFGGDLIEVERFRGGIWKTYEEMIIEFFYQVCLTYQVNDGVVFRNNWEEFTPPSIESLMEYFKEIPSKEAKIFYRKPKVVEWGGKFSCPVEQVIVDSLSHSEMIKMSEANNEIMKKIGDAMTGKEILEEDKITCSCGNEMEDDFNCNCDACGRVICDWCREWDGSAPIKDQVGKIEYKGSTTVYDYNGVGKNYCIDCYHPKIGESVGSLEKDESN